MRLVDDYLTSWQTVPSIQKTGYVTQSIGLIVEGVCPGAFINEVCLIRCVNHTYVKAQVVGFKEQRVMLMPYEKSKSFSFGNKLIATGQIEQVTFNENLLGTTLNGFGEPLLNKSKSEKKGQSHRKYQQICPHDRKSIDEVFVTGIKVIDSFLTLGKGQRVGLFAGSGVGKSSLLIDVFNNIHHDDVVSIAVLIGERGREAQEFIEHAKQNNLNTIIIVATAEEPAIARVQALHSAIEIANHYSEQGKDVLVTIDSLTRFAYALREIGLAMGEPVTVKGYTPSVFSKITSVVEQFGSFKSRGSITAIMTVLADGDDLYDPVVDSVRAIIDGHIVLSRELAEKNHFPAIDISKSISRLFNQLNNSEHKHSIARLRKSIAEYYENKEVIELGIVDQENASLTRIKDNYKLIESYVMQNLGEPSSIDKTLHDMKRLLSELK